MTHRAERYQADVHGKNDEFEEAVASLIEQEQAEEIVLPDNSMAYFARRLAVLSIRQSKGAAEFPEGMGTPPAGKSR